MVRLSGILTLHRIGELDAIEGEICGQLAAWRLEERQLRSKPLLVELEGWLREKVKALSRHTETAKAFNYVLNQWTALIYYSDDGRAEPEAYLRHVLMEIADWPSNRIHELLPWNIVIPSER